VAGCIDAYFYNESVLALYRGTIQVPATSDENTRYIVVNYMANNTKKKHDLVHPNCTVAIRPSCYNAH